jgi:hypothetical protein
MESVVLFVSIYPMFAVPAGLGAALVWFSSREHLRVLPADRLMFLLPYASWFGVAIHGSALGVAPKSLSNIVEAGIVGGVVAGLLGARTMLTIVRPFKEDRWAWGALVLGCLVAPAIALWVPPLPE